MFYLERFLKRQWAIVNQVAHMRAGHATAQEGHTRYDCYMKKTRLFVLYV